MYSKNFLFLSLNLVYLKASLLLESNELEVICKEQNYKSFHEFCDDFWYPQCVNPTPMDSLPRAEGFMIKDLSSPHAVHVVVSLSHL
jgi:hypothetical protein